MEEVSVNETLKQRGSVYGEFSDQIECIARIVAAMSDCYKSNNGESASHLRYAEWHYLAIKLARIASNPDHIDSYHDLAGYSIRMEQERIKALS